MAASRVAAILPAAAIGVIAACLSIVGHETIGHGGACLSAGGRVILLNIVDFRCASVSPWIDLAGPAGNLGLALVGALLARAGGPDGARLLGLALFAFNAFWIAGYLLYAGVLGQGDFIYPLGLVMSESLWRPLTLGGGALLYMAAMNRLAAGTPPTAAPSLRTAYVAAAIAAVLAAAVYAPARMHVIQQAALEIGLASFGLWFAMRRARGPGDWTPPTSQVWTITGVTLWLALAAIQGPGLPH